MMRSSLCRRCAKAASSAGGLTFAERFEKMRTDPENPLSCSEYTYMRERLAEYSALQTTYAVKQTEVERARKAANMCGLEFTGKGERREV